MRHSAHQSGFTLLELIIALTLFSIVIALGYQSITRLAINQRSIERHSKIQTGNHLAHLALSSALNSGAKLSGNSRGISLELNTSDSLHFPQSSKQTFILTNGRLLSETSQDNKAIQLMDNIELASFSFLNDGLRQSLWEQDYAPQIVEINWQQNGRQQQWLFATR